MSGFVKLFGSIVHSTIWREPDHIRLTWITMLALSDRDGVVEASIPGLADVSRVTIAQCEEAINHLTSPDRYSRSREHDGRRIEAIDGGWQVLNYSKYREKLSKAEVREKAADRQRRKRQRDANSHKMSQPSQNVTAVTRNNDIADADAEADADTDTDRKEDRIPPKKTVSRYSAEFEAFRKSYPQHRLGGKTQDWKSWQVAKKAGMTTEVAQAALCAWKTCDQWVGDGGKYIVALSRWLREGYWDTEPPQANQSGMVSDLDRWVATREGR